MENQDKSIEARKLSDEELESAKGGATFASLSRFVVSASAVRSPVIGKFNPVADTNMCAGQTRSILVDFGSVSILR